MAGKPVLAPIDRIVLEQERRTITGLSRTTAWREERAGRFPRRFEISPGRSGWLYSEIQEWLEERIASRAKKDAVEEASTAKRVAHPDEEAEAEVEEAA